MIMYDKFFTNSPQYQALTSSALKKSISSSVYDKTQKNKKNFWGRPQKIFPISQNQTKNIKSHSYKALPHTALYISEFDKNSLYIIIHLSYIYHTPKKFTDHGTTKSYEPATIPSNQLPIDKKRHPAIR